MRKKIFTGALIFSMLFASSIPAYANTPQTSIPGTDGFSSFEGDDGSFVNVRSSASQSGDVIGRLYADSIVHIEGEDEYGWLKIKSGNVEGYVASQYIATGKEAEKIAKKTGYTTVKAEAEVLNVRRAKNTDSDSVDTVKESDEIEVLENDGDWIKVATKDGIYGYVSSSYVSSPKTEYRTALTNEEAEEKEEKEKTDYTKDGTNVSRETFPEYFTISEEEQQDENEASENEASDAFAYDKIQSGTEVSRSEGLNQQETQVAETQPDAADKAPSASAQPSAPQNTLSDDEKAYLETLPKETQDLFYAYKEAEKSGDTAKATDLYNQYMAAVSGAASSAQETQPQSETQPETQMQPETQPETQGQSETQAQPETQTQPETQQETQPETQPETQAETQAPSQPQAGYSDTDLMAAIIYCEAGNQPYEGKVAVGAVVMNRISSPSFPGNIRDVLYQSGQFQPAGNLENVLSSGLVSSECYTAAADAMAGNDPTGGCLYFNNHRGEGLHIGGHWFY